MPFTKTDSIKFGAYSILFLLLFFGYNTVSSPYFETTFDSASITNVEMPMQTQETVTEKIIRKNIPTIKKQPIIEKFTIAFNPEYIHIDAGILQKLETQINSAYFQSKVTPLNLLIDTERKEPRGQVVGNKLILSSQISTDSERIKVFVHELGHIIDIYYLHKGLI